VEAVISEVAGRARHLIGHAAEELAAIGELDAAALRLGSGRARHHGRDDRRALEDGSARHVRRRDTGRGFVAAAHGDSPGPEWMTKLVTRLFRINATVFPFCRGG